MWPQAGLRARKLVSPQIGESTKLPVKLFYICHGLPVRPCYIQSRLLVVHLVFRRQLPVTPFRVRQGLLVTQFRAQQGLPVIPFNSEERVLVTAALVHGSKQGHRASGTSSRVGLKVASSIFPMVGYAQQLGVRLLARVNSTTRGYWLGSFHRCVGRCLESSTEFGGVVVNKFTEVISVTDVGPIISAAPTF